MDCGAFSLENTPILLKRFSQVCSDTFTVSTFDHLKAGCIFLSSKLLHKKIRLRCMRTMLGGSSYNTICTWISLNHGRAQRRTGGPDHLGKSKVAIGFLRNSGTDTPRAGTIACRGLCEIRSCGTLHV